MSNKKTVLELNGRRYDATTGELLPARPHTKAGVIDDFTPVKSPAAAQTNRQPLQPVTKKPAMDIIRHSSQSVPGHAPQHPKTLMRRSVHKPAVRQKLKVAAYVAAEDRQIPATEAGQATLARADNKRLSHARRVSKSPLISRFGDVAAVQPAPVPAAAADRPVAVGAARPVTARKARTTADLLQHALDQATSHEQPKLKRPRHTSTGRRIIRGGTISVAVVALIGLFVSQNFNTVRLQVASARAGFSASVPGYQPAGFSLSKINSGSGVVALNYASNSDNDRNFSVTEKASSWDSQTLRDMFVAPAGDNYQTVQAGGRTIYLYGQYDATWVDGGVWYQVQSQNALSNQQLIQLADSL